MMPIPDPHCHCRMAALKPALKFSGAQNAQKPKGTLASFSILASSLASGSIIWTHLALGPALPPFQDLLLAPLNTIPPGKVARFPDRDVPLSGPLLTSNPSSTVRLEQKPSRPPLVSADILIRVSSKWPDGSSGS